jgi:hypothetical protein
VLALIAAVSGPLAVDVEHHGDQLAIDLVLEAAFPDELESALTDGGRTEIQYLVRVYAPRWLIPDRRVWRGTAESVVSFDAVTGRYLCQLIVNGTTTRSMETEDAERARAWLTSPPTIEIPLPKGRRDGELRVRARAVFSRGTTWLVFPTTDGTPWQELQLTNEGSSS